MAFAGESYWHKAWKCDFKLKMFNKLWLTRDKRLLLACPSNVQNGSRYPQSTYMCLQPCVSAWVSGTCTHTQCAMYATHTVHSSPNGQSGNSIYLWCPALLFTVQLTISTSQHRDYPPAVRRASYLITNNGLNACKPSWDRTMGNTFFWIACLTGTVSSPRVSARPQGG